MGRGSQFHRALHKDALSVAVANGPEQSKNTPFRPRGFSDDCKIWVSPDTPIISTDESNVCRCASEVGPGDDRPW